MSGEHGGYAVVCEQCGPGELLRSSWYDLAENFAGYHDDHNTGHASEVVEVPGG